MFLELPLFNAYLAFLTGEMPARNLGVEIESICGGHLTCEKCQVRIEEGQFQKHGIVSSAEHLTPASTAEQELLGKKFSQGYRSSCAALVQDDVLVFVPEESRTQKQVIRKAATDRAIEIDPAVRQLYVVVEEAQLGKHRGDWGRVQDALTEQWDLAGLSIDFPVLHVCNPSFGKVNGKRRSRSGRIGK